MTNALISIAWTLFALFAMCSTFFWAGLVKHLASRTADGKMNLSNDDKDFIAALVIALAAMWFLVAYFCPFRGA